jgi:hypothetical protein
VSVVRPISIGMMFVGAIRTVRVMNDVLKCDYESSHRIQDEEGNWEC